jgi:hypothetical protein
MSTDVKAAMLAAKESKRMGISIIVWYELTAK